MTGVAVLSFRLGGPDGVSVEAAKWMWALEQLGFTVRTVADHTLPGLAIDADEPPQRHELEAALDGADLVVVENLLSLPLNPGAAAVVVDVLRGRPAVIHHHDLAQQHARFAGHPPPPDDPAWRHVTINELSRRQLADAGIDAVVVRNRFDPDPPPGDRDATRSMLGVSPDETLLVQPTRAIARKNIPQSIALAEAVGAVLWIVGPAEMGYGPELDRLRAAASVRTIHGPTQAEIRHAYAAADAVTFPSTWEGFGNPTIESALHRRALAIGDYPIADELRSLGFRWLRAADPGDLRRWLEEPDPSVLDHNQAVARAHFNLHDLPAALAAVLP